MPVSPIVPASRAARAHCILVRTVARPESHAFIATNETTLVEHRVRPSGRRAADACCYTASLVESGDANRKNCRRSDIVRIDGWIPLSAWRGMPGTPTSPHRRCHRNHLSRACVAPDVLRTSGRTLSGPTSTEADQAAAQSHHPPPVSGRCEEYPCNDRFLSAPGSWPRACAPPSWLA